jgi:Ca2+-binding RTX toxin-like protein
MGSGTSLAAVLDTTTLVAGVYSAASLSTVAGATLTLDGQGLANQTWIFNIADILALGANTKIDLVNVGENASVVWNSNGYASIGADAQVVGTILAQNYISVGANTIITGPNGTNGGLFAQTDYITFGAGAHVGIAGNSSDTIANLVTGTAEANSLVTLYSEHSTLGTVTADGSGNFSYTLTTLNVSTLGVEANKVITASIVDTGLHTVTSTGFVYNDHLGGSFGNDALVGTTGNDTIHGGIGNDLLQGGAGNDLLFGGVGADVFKWSLLETGADVIKDFNLAPVASGGDVLDLKDLLVGESANAGSLQAYLHFSANSAGQTVISVDAHGGVPSAVEQTITLENIQYTALQTYAHGASDTAILAKLLGDGHLKTDI